MKKKYIIILFASALLFSVQSCKTKSKETASAEDSTAMATKVSAEPEARMSKKQEREERRKAAEARKAGETYEASGVTVYNRTSVKPEFKGGKDAMNKYFKDNLKYPAGDSWQGTIVVDFVIGADGKVNMAEVNTDVDSVSDQNCREEAIRVVKEMPAWTAAKQNGKAVATSYSLPVTFQQN